MTYPLRPYQRECIDAIHARFAEANSTLVVMATGTGKTVVFATLAHGWKHGRVLVLAHREELIFQAAEKVRAITGREPGIEMAQQRAGAQHTVISSVQTLCRPERLSRFDPHQFELVTIDEAHHAVAATYTRVVDHFRQNTSCKVLGVTATPKRADQLAMGQVFQTVAFEYGIEPAAADGWLVPLRQQVVKVDGLDFSKVRTTAGDLNEGDLDAIMREEEILHKVARPTVDLVGDLPTIVFCVTVEHAKRMSEVIERYRPQSAAYVSGETPKDERRALLARFKAGKLQFLCNVGVLLEGFDAPAACCLSMARPTKSLVVYTQGLGRVTRPLPGVIDGLDTADARKAAIATSAKPSALVLDFVGNAGRHQLVTAADLLGGKYSVAVRDYAKKTQEQEGKAALVGDALDRAQAELLYLDEERERIRVRERIKAEASYRVYGASPFGNSASTGTATAAPGDKPPSQKQLNYLVYLGYNRRFVESVRSARQASALITRKLKEQGHDD